MVTRLSILRPLRDLTVAGWGMSTRMKARLVCDALQMAVWQRQPQAGLIVHSDRGSQYASKQYRQLLKNTWFYRQYESCGKLLGKQA